jgi:hypothetical protein
MRRGLALLLTGLALLVGMPAKAADNAAVCVVSTKANQAFLEELKGDLRKGVSAWLAAAAELALPARVIGEYELGGPINDCRLLVLHLSYRLSDAQVEVIERYYADGGSLLLVGLPGKYTETGGFRQEALTDRLLGLTNSRPFTPKEAQSSFFQVATVNPASLVLEPGLRMELDWSGTYWMADVASPGAFLTDWGMYPTTERDATRTALMAFKDAELGRVAWMGFSPEAVLPSPDPTAGPVLARSVLAWAAGIPMAAKGWWPAGAPAVAVIGTDIGYEPVVPQHLAAAYVKEGFKGSFFLAATSTPELAGTLAALASAGSVGTSGVAQLPLKDMALEAQVAEMEQARKNLQAAGLGTVSGFRLPEEAWDAQTPTAAAKAGYDFIYGNSSFDRAWPLRYEVEGKVLWHFARIIPDYYGAGPEASEGDFVKAFGLEAGRLIRLGGLLVLNFDAKLLGDPESTGLASLLFKWLRDQHLKLASFQELTAWLAAREQVKLTATPGRASMELTLTNQSSGFIKQFPVVYAPPVPKKPEIIRGAEGVTVGERSGPGFVLLVDLAPFETKKLLVR